MLCPSGQCYPQVFGLFLFTPLCLRKPLACSIHLTLNSTFPLLNTACLPRACVPAVSPHGSDLSAAYQVPLRAVSYQDDREYESESAARSQRIQQLVLRGQYCGPNNKGSESLVIVGD
jgi:hypothetical protein